MGRRERIVPPDALAAADVPRIAARFRLQFEPAQAAWVLLYPEGMVKLSHSAAAIMQQVDGARSVAGVIAGLEAAFPGAALRRDVIDFLAVARERGWIVC
jgi:pyrroloquinoline quinone biosynthesis protein D